MSVPHPVAPAAQRSTILGMLLVIVVAIGLTAIFWPTLWSGGGLVGGDIYSYFYPQKQFYAESLRAGEIPLWNNRTGNGYPTVGESQTGVFYPFHALYAVLDLNTAYNTIQLGHYVLAFVWCWLFARRWGLAFLPACLAAVVYTYGWLPTRMCVEWAALGAAWFPAALWCGESFLQTAHRRYLVILSLVLGLQMLAGHFHLAFITQITLVGYLGLRLFVVPEKVLPTILTQRFKAVVCCSIALLCGFGLAAIQLGPTWELKQLSQRAALGDEHDPGYGYIPWWYLGQLVAPWAYYVPGLSLGSTPVGASRTNTVEAHLYCGLIPLLLACVGIFWRSPQADRRNKIWWLLGVLSLVYATGTLMPVAKHLPGFGFFNGVGRYGIIFNLAIGLLAAEALQRFVGPRRTWKAIGIVFAVLVLTTSDVWMISRMVQHSVAVLRPPLRYLSKSPIREELARSPVPVRLFCRGANLPNLLGVSSTPVYLGIGPQAYFDPRWKMPEPLPYDTLPTSEQLDWLRRAGVTHILSFTPLDLAAWPATMVLATPDPFLNLAWARGFNEPFYLYELTGSRGRVAWANPVATAAAQITSYQANSVSIATDSPVAGTLILTDLRWPGWQVQVDGRPAVAVADDTAIGPYRAVEVPAGHHTVTWIFHPNSVWIGGMISAVTAMLLVVMATSRRLYLLKPVTPPA
ncbi:MAG: hypothetical protein V4719_04075 [Planctomycetota bacterium]